MKKLLSLSMLIFTLSLSATTPEEGKKIDWQKFMSEPIAAEKAVFWCMYCVKQLEKSVEIDYKAHLGSVHKRCGICEAQCGNIGLVRKCEATHFSKRDLRLQPK